MRVILDTNFLIYCAKNKLDYVEEIGNLINEGFELVVPMQVVEEMKKLKDDKWKKVSGKDKDAIALALQLLEVNNVKKVKISGKSVDEGIVNLANENKKNIACTLDREMRHNLPRVILVNKFKKLMITR
jgi:rRNA-processing protein FCF1